MAKKKEISNDDWGMGMDQMRKQHGVHMLALGFKIFLVGSIFWIGGILAWPWYESVTFIGLILFVVGWIKKMGGMHENY